MSTDQGSERLERLRARLRERSPHPGDSVSRQRADFEAAVRSMPLAHGVTIEPVSARGVRAEWVIPANRLGSAAILYFHGGGYVIGSLNTIRPMASNVAVAAQAPVLTVDYRLAPEHPHPAAVEDAVAMYEWLLDAGHAPEHIAVGGDSAGGGLAIATLLAAREAHLRQPAGCFALSPWTDLTLSGASLSTNAATDPQVQRWLLEEMAGHYLAGADPRTALASPCFADLRGLAPMLIHVGAAEALLDDARGFADAAAGAGAGAGNDVTFESWEHMIHVWHAFAPILPEASAAIDRVGEWLRARWSAGSPARMS